MTKEQILENYTPIPYCGCWIWKGAITDNGYGSVWYKRKPGHPHRLVYQFTKGPVPEGMYVCHLCDTPSCINPDHLFIGTPKDNNADCIAKGRAVYVRGEKNGQAKLKERDVIRIRQSLAQCLPHAEIARLHGVSKSTISWINTGKSWGWL